jgi:hypothetical protein
MFVFRDFSLVERVQAMPVALSLLASMGNDVQKLLHSI